MLITSLQNPRVKNLVRLREGRQRRKQGVMIIDGARETLRAQLAGVALQEVWCCPDWCQADEAQQLLATLNKQSQIEVFQATAAVFEKLVFGERTDGIIAVATPPQRDLTTMHWAENPLCAVISGIEKPGNVGAVLRSADGAGISNMIIADPQTDLFNPATIRSSLGTVFALNMATATNAETLTTLREQRLLIYAAALDPRAIPYDQADFNRPCAIVLGSEDQGLGSEWLTPADDLQLIQLPMHGIADSLNISATAAVLFYEARRQRGANKLGF